MMKKLIKLAVCSCLALTLAGCETATRQDVGMVAGGALGGLLGSQVGHGDARTAAIIGGTLLGGFLGGAVGKNMDDTDRLKMQQALESNRTNQAASWSNPDTGAHYTVKPVRTYTRQTRRGTTQPCREFINEAIIGGKKQQVYGTACRQADRSWKIVSQD